MRCLKLYGRWSRIKRISDKELDKISGGGVEWFAVGLGIVTLIVFISGIIEGYTNPGRCS